MRRRRTLSVRFDSRLGKVIGFDRCSRVVRLSSLRFDILVGKVMPKKLWERKVTETVIEG